MNPLYPLLFTPIFKERIWGGGKIKSLYAYEEAPETLCGEAWLLSGVEGENSVVANGDLAGNELNELVEVFMGDLVGDRIYEEHSDKFPLLLKIIDANTWLSIQVHPDDALAMKRYGSNGKSEMWYVLEADQGAELISGFRHKISSVDFLRHMENKSLEQVLNREPVARGDVFDLPAGRIHAVGPGIVLAEIQQTSDVTYRIHDWDRVDAKGKSRELHLDLALDAIDFEVPPSYRSHYHRELNRASSLSDNPHFTANLIRLNQGLKKDYEELDSFVAYMGVEGRVNISAGNVTVPLKAGHALLIPNLLKNVTLEPVSPMAAVLEIYIK